MLAHVITVIAPEDDNRAVPKLQAIHLIHQLANLRVREGNHRMIGSLALRSLLCIHSKPWPRLRGLIGPFRTPCLFVSRQLSDLAVCDWIMLKPMLRRDIRRVRFVETRSDEERLVLVFLEKLDRLRCDQGVRVLLVLACVFEIRHRAAEPALGRVVDDVILDLLVPTARIDRHVP